MDPRELETALDLVEAARQRAIAVLTGPPYNKLLENADESRIDLDGEEAVLYDPFVQGDYDGGGYLSEKVFRFPASLLAMSDDEFEQWRRKEKARHESVLRRERRLGDEAAERQREIEERHTLSRLKAKYERDRD